MVLSGRQELHLPPPVSKTGNPLRVFSLLGPTKGFEPSPRHSQCLMRTYYTTSDKKKTPGESISFLQGYRLTRYN